MGYRGFILNIELVVGEVAKIITIVISAASSRNGYLDTGFIKRGRYPVTDAVGAATNQDVLASKIHCCE